MKKRWVFPDSQGELDPPDLSQFHPIERQILTRRGLHTPEAVRDFLATDPVDHNPLELSEVEEAVDRIRHAVAHGEQITVFGDYDVDGVAATALLLVGLRSRGASVHHYLPDRFEEGYGLNPSAMEEIAGSGTTLLITVDCGVRSLAEVELANRLRMDVLITDHHEPGPDLPAAIAILNPRKPGDGYPFKHLTGVGLVYKLLSALHNRLGGTPSEHGLDLVALGTIADVAPLVGENRSLTQRGLAVLNRLERPGLRALAESAGVAPGKITARTVGFILGPRLNAAGRLDSASIALDLLLTDRPARASSLAKTLEQLNRKRQKLTERVFEAAKNRVAADTGSPLLAVADEGFNEGVIGLAAGRLAEQFHRPAIVATLQGELARASARSIPGFHITRALEQNHPMLLRYGGHAAAAGFTLERESWVDLIDRLKSDAAAQLTDDMLQPTLEIDVEVGFSDLDDQLLRFFDSLEPLGEGNPLPVLATRGVRILDRRVVGREGTHLKLTLSAQRKPIDAIAFGWGGAAPELPEQVDVAYHFERNEYLGYTSHQLRVIDFRY